MDYGIIVVTGFFDWLKSIVIGRNKDENENG